MLSEEKMADKLIFPDGREINVEGLLSFLYNLGESEIQVLEVLMASNDKLTSEEIANRLKVSKASVNKAINNLISKGLVEKEKVIVDEKKKGRPTFAYYVRSDYINKKISEDTFNVVFNVKETLKKLLSERA